MKAITVHRPWGYAIAHLGKRIENRTWRCPLKPGEWLAIHNGKKWDKSGEDFIKKINPTELIDNPTPESDPEKAIIAVARFKGNVRGSASEWFVGPWGWEFDEVVVIAPVPCPGQERLWDIPDQILSQIRINYSKAKAKG